MKPLRVALMVKNEGMTRRDDRQMGYFSYAVPEFTWQPFVCGKQYVIDTRELARAGYDLVLHEDFASEGFYLGSGLPVVYLDIDSTVSTEHFRTRVHVARQADLILVDQAPLRWWQTLGKPVRRLPYCVNDRVFRERGLERTVDVALHMSKSASLPGYEVRSRVGSAVAEACATLGLTWRKGRLGLEDYAVSMSTAKVVVNWPRVPANRPHRVFDAMACGAALLTGPLPDIAEDRRVGGQHYAVVRKPETLPDALVALLEGEHWRALAAAGLALVQTQHTWAVRAGQLRAVLLEAFPDLRERAA